jgi:hypothetical protein
MVVVKFTARQKDHLVATLVCAIQFTLGTACLTINVSNFLAMFFQQLFSMALVSLTVRVTHFLLPIGMQKRLGVSTHSNFQSNLRIVTHSSLNCPSASIRNKLLFKSNSVFLPAKAIPTNTRVLQRGLLFLFIHWFNEGCCVEGGESGKGNQGVIKYS